LRGLGEVEGVACQGVWSPSRHLSLRLFNVLSPAERDSKREIVNLMYRTHTCGELRLKDAGNIVTLAGWVQTVRKFGAITFVDLRDRYGLTQLLFGEELTRQLG